MSTLLKVRNQRDAILAIAHRHGVRHVKLFGSVVRGQERPDSDLDVLVDMEQGRSLLDLVAFGHALEDLLGRRVDVLSERGISPYVEKSILAEATPL